VDWRAQVRKHPRAMMGAALGGGLLVALMAGSRKTRPGARTARRREHESGGDEELSVAHDTWEMFKGALVEAAAMQVTEYVVELLPDVREHLDAQRNEGPARRQRAPVGSAPDGGAEPWPDL